MISAIRKKFGSWLLDAFIWLAIIAFVLVYFIPADKKRAQNGQWVINVNGAEIDYQQYLQALQAAKRNQISTEVDSKIEQRVIDGLTDQLLMEQLAEQLKLEITPAMVESRLMQMMAMGMTGGNQVDLASLKNMLGAEQFQAIQDGLAKDTSSEVVRNMLTGELYIPNFALENSYRSDYAFKKYGIITVPYAKIQGAVAAHQHDTAALKAFFAAQNQASKRYWLPEMRTGTVWTFTPGNFDLKVSDTQIQNYYNRHRKEEFVKQAAQVQVRRILFENDRTKAQEVRLELAKDGSKFAELAKKYSDDKLTADKGGLMDFFTEGSQEESFARAAFDLQSDGEISEVIETKRGFEILQRVGRKPATYKTLEEVAGEIRQKVTEEQFQKLFLMNARQVIAKSAAHPEVLKEFVAAKKAQRQELKQVEKSGKLEVAKLFELKKAGTKSAFIDGKNGVIVILEQVVPAKVKDFEQYRAQIAADYQKHLVDQELQRVLNQAVADLTAGQTLAQVAQKLGLEFEETPLISRDTFQKLETLRKKGLPVEAFWSLKYQGAYKTQIQTDAAQPSGYLIQLEVLQKAAAEDFKAKKGAILRGQSYQYAGNLQQSLIASLRKNATIKVNTAIINLGA